LPLPVIGLLAAVWQAKVRFPLNRQQQALLLWGMWFLTEVIFFSFFPPGHRYYLVVLGPPTAALVGVAVMVLWHNYQHPNARGWLLLPMALVMTAAVQAYFLVDYYPGWSRLVTPLVLGLCIPTAGVLLAARLRAKSHLSAVSALAAATGTLTLLIAPTIWSAASIEQKDLLALNEDDVVRTQIPIAGPDVPSNRVSIGWHRSEGLWPANSFSATADPQMVDYLESNRGGARFLMATSNSMLAAPLIIDTGEPVMAFGGFHASDPILTPTKLGHLVDDGDVRFFLLWDGSNLAEGMDTDVQNWVRESCARVPSQLWRSTATEVPDSMSGFDLNLYDCSEHT
jgi:4-amino-4-deoxy-L-arabinose transferase-like glycosyltransferase